MRIAEVIGTVTLNRALPSFKGGRLKVVVPWTLGNLAHREPATAEPIVAWDDLGGGIGSIIAISEGGEAAQPFRPDHKPVDCYSAAILDHFDLLSTDDLDPPSAP
ncbi:MAG: carbon dioxide concentrating mechanism protein CcmL [Planctomycetes bacterium]|nr:carbon dioxide concentrating mechanism protein CcmL [Planctomycetota bacterium]